jgi:hypothetical protein
MEETNKKDKLETPEIYPRIHKINKGWVSF